MGTPEDTEIAKLRDALRWRDANEEKPEEGTLVIVILKGMMWPNIVQASGKAFWESDIVTHWRPVGPLPKENELMDEQTLKILSLKREIDRLEAENAKLREAARWRKWPKEKPETDEEFLVLTEEEGPYVAAYMPGAKTFTCFERVTHWQPIVALPEESK